MNLPQARLVIGLWVLAVGLLVTMHFLCSSSDAFGIPDGPDAIILRSLAFVAFTGGTWLATREGKPFALWQVISAIVTGGLTILLIDSLIWICKVVIGK